MKTLLLLAIATLLLAGCSTTDVTLPNGVHYKSTETLLSRKRGPVSFTQTSATASTLTVGASEVNQTGVAKAMINLANELAKVPAAP